MTNRLITETSPYLLQHAENPVDWFPWGDEAFEKARREDKPVFLSVGYSACHWCHVMEHESFENAETAEVMNRHFVSVKVDREERPDVDAVYMDAVQTLTGRGGWPMSVFLTPEAVPFYAGTYFPDEPRYGMPSFQDVLSTIELLWSTRRGEVLEAGMSLTRDLARQASNGDAGSRLLDPTTLDEALRGLSRAFDADNGGWGGAPKFPQPAVVEFVLRRHLALGDDRLLDMVTRTLDAMMDGGIYDQLGGGFHRYATDEVWLVPHFEKMLYDNAQLARLYLHAWQVTGNKSYRRVVTETLDYIAREMVDTLGGFYSAQDADSEGEEGRFFLWTPEEIRRGLVGSSERADIDAAWFMEAYGVTESGNFEGSNILSASRSASEIAAAHGAEAAEVELGLERSRRALLSVRSTRVRPALDDKVLAGWNGLALAAFAEAARVLDRDDYRALAEKNADFVLSAMRNAEGRMLRTWKGGHAKLNGYLEDYVHYAEGLLQLYETTFQMRWFSAARELTDLMVEHFADPAGGFFDTSDDHESLIVRPKSLQDGAIPSGGATAAGVLIRMAHLTGVGSYSDFAEKAISQVQTMMAQAPLGFAQWLAALDLIMAPPQEVAIVGDEVGSLLDVVRARYRPNLVVAVGSPGQRGGQVELLQGRDAVGGRATAYVCRQLACERPVTGPRELDELLG
jgi:uncharacterized protein YyaL (SSP411 family)